MALMIGLGSTVDHARAQDAPASRGWYSWEQLAELPEPLGVAGPCAGVSNGALVVAGGAHFPVPLLSGGRRVWTRATWALSSADRGELRWHTSDSLPQPRGYAVPFTVGDEVLCVGGGNAEEHFADVLSLRWVNGRVVTEERLPPLPEPVAFASGARVGEVLYIAGGLRAPGDSVAQRSFWSLDLTNPSAGWRLLDPWPGPARYDAVAASLNGAFYLFSGVEPHSDGAGGISYDFLTDAYRYRPGEGWKRLADLPWPVAAAPSPAIPLGPSHLMVLGGNDGSLVGRTEELGDRHPGFRREALLYHTTTDTWVRGDSLPAAHVNTPTVAWGGRTVIPS